MPLVTKWYLIENEMDVKPQMKIPATYMRGGTSKGVFFNKDDLPLEAQQPSAVRDQILLSVIGSPDPYGKQIDGMGGASSSTSKTVIVSKSSKDGHDVDYIFGQVAIDKPFVDWSGNCGNLTAAVGSFAIRQGLVTAEKIPENGVCEVSVWQVNIQKTIVVSVPIKDGQVQEIGDFQLDGVTFPAAEIKVAFIDPADSQEGNSLFPTGQLIDTLDVPDVGTFQATFINSGIPTIFLNAADLGYLGTERPDELNNDVKALERLEKIRAYGAQKMGLIQDISEAQARQHTPKIAWVAPPRSYRASDGKPVDANKIDVLVRALSMGKLHHAMMGTAAVAIATAAAIPNTIVSQALSGGAKSSVRFGHTSGTMTVGAVVEQDQHQSWKVKEVLMSRSARTLMEGWVYIPVELGVFI